MLAEESGNRWREFQSNEVLEIIDPSIQITAISSALQVLRSRGLVRQGKNIRHWYVTEKGWNSYFRVSQPLTGRAKVVRPTT